MILCTDATFSSMLLPGVSPNRPKNDQNHFLKPTAQHRVPKAPQATPKGPPRHPKATPRTPKAPPRHPKGPAKAPQASPKGARASQERPRSHQAQETPRAHQERRRAPQEGPDSPTSAPRLDVRTHLDLFGGIRNQEGTIHDLFAHVIKILDRNRGSLQLYCRSLTRSDPLTS